VRRFGRWLVRVVAAGAVLYGAVFVYVLGVSRRDERTVSDAILVLGAAQYNGRPSDVLRARLDHAAELYLTERAPLIVVTGGMAAGDVVSEATVSRQYLVSHGVVDTAVVVLPIGSNSRESVASAAEWLLDRRLETVILVSDPFHMARLGVEARGHGLAAATSPTQTSPISRRLGAELKYLSAEALKLPIVWITHKVLHR
jgi:uncharacterized SAM-binding protein YcdF (DUF218 family)